MTKAEYKPGTLHHNLHESEVRPIPEVELTELLEASGGELRIVVHPFFEPNPIGNRKHLHQVREANRRLFASNSPEKLPILALVEHSSTSPLHLAKDMGSKVFTFPTVPGAPHPYYLHNGQQVKYELAWPKFSNMLQRIGAKKIVVGGLLLRKFNQKSNRLPSRAQIDQATSINYFACVGGVIRELSARGFKIEASHITFPENF